MSITVERQPESGACVVALSGDIDLSVVPQIRSELESAISTGCATLVLDLSNVDYADSTALGLLVWIDRRLAPSSGRLVLCGANPDIQRILELSGLIGVAPTITQRQTREEALDGLTMASTTEEPQWREVITARADVANLADLRVRIVALIETLGLGESALFDVKVAVGEALANAVRHGSPRGTEDEVVVGVSAFPDRVAIEVSDAGCGFDGTPRNDADVYAASGRGIMFMRALMDAVEFVPCQGSGTTVRLVKSLPRES